MQKIPSSTLEAIEALELPALPGALLQFMRAVTQEGVAMDSIAELVRAEPALATRILTVANSAAFRSDGGIRTIPQSLQVLGVRILRSLAACLAVQQAFGPLAGLRVEDLAGFWRHSLLVAELAQAFATAMDGVEPEEAYLAGLLHDVGELLLLGGLGSRYGALLDQAQDEVALSALERAALSTDHAAVGAWLVDRWHLPAFMADAVRFHHEAEQDLADADALTRTVWAAHQAATIATYATPEVAGFNAVAQLLGLEPMALARVCATAQSNVLQLSAAMAVPSAHTTLPAWRPVAAPPAPPLPGLALNETLAAMAVLQPLHSELAAADAELAWLAVARQAACILCGVRDVVFLIGEGQPLRLRGRPLPGQLPLLGHFQVPMDTRANDAAARAAQSLTICTSFDDPPGPGAGLRDRQLAGVLGSEGLLCVPMTQGQSLWGVMVCPVSRAAAQPLHRRRALLETLGSILAEQWQAWHSARRSTNDRQSAATDQWLLREREVAHEINNPLSVIKIYLKMVESKLPAALGLDGEFQLVREEIDRVARIVQELGRGPGAEAQPAQGEDRTDLNQEVEGLSLLYGPALFQTTGIDSILQLQRPLAPTKADRDAVRQVLLNLWKNAAEALPSGSRIVTGTADHVHLEGRIYTQLSVVDNGPGLPADVTQRLYQPLGMQRRPGNSGLGLSIVGQLVAQLGGRISCQSTPGHGTGFTILLPQHQTPLNPPVSP